MTVRHFGGISHFTIQTLNGLNNEGCRTTIKRKVDAINI